MKNMRIMCTEEKKVMKLHFVKNKRDYIAVLTRILLTWRIWWAPNTPNKWQMEFNLAFKGLKNAVHFTAA